MKAAIQRLMNEHGTDLVITRSDNTQVTVRAFFGAINSTSWQSLESKATLLGEITRGQYSYLGPTGTTVKEGDTLSLGGKIYLFRRVESYYYQGQAIYQWGLCVEKGVNDTWGSLS